MCPLAQRRAHERARSAGSAGSRDSCASKRGVKKLPDCRNSAAERARVAALGVQHRERAEARAHADRGALDARPPRRSRAGRRARGRRRSAPRRSTTRCARPGASSATRCGGSVPARDRRRRRSRVSPASRSYSGPSWATSSGSGSPGPASAGLQTPTATSAPSPCPGSTAPRCARHASARRATRRRVARQQQHRLLAERAGRRCGLPGSQTRSAAAVGVDDLELVLEPRDGRRAPAPAATRRCGGRRRAARRSAAGRSTAARRRTARRGRRGGGAPPDDGGIRRARFVLTSVPPISEYARTPHDRRSGRGRGPSTSRSLPPMDREAAELHLTPSGTTMSSRP